MYADQQELLCPVTWPARASDLQGWRAQLEAYNNWEAEQFLSADIETLVQQRALFFDGLLSQLWQKFGLDDQRFALLAVGGYGRGTLHPGSDIDLLFLHQRALEPEDEERLSALLTLLWDLKLDLGHAVRTVAQCLELAADDLTIATNLIEHRPICGCANLAEQLQQAIIYDFPWPSRAFYAAKCREQQERHQRYHSTAYNLEPDIKSSPGGLRDIQTVGWIAKQHFKTRSDESLVKYNYFTADEFIELQECTAYLWRVRYALHLAAGKKEDRLLFDYQPEVARQLGYAREPDNTKEAVERMMKDYFNVVLQVNELNRMLLQFFGQAIISPVELSQPEPLDERFARVDNQIMARAEEVFAEPANLLRFFVAIARHYPQVNAIHPQTIRLLRNAREQLAEPLCENPDCRRLFCELIAHPHGPGRAFELMHRHGIMARYLPAWQQIVGQMQFDLFHAYTVDEHTYRLLRNLYHFTLPEYDDEFPLCSELAQSFTKPELLFLAAIFHDIAKGRGGDHSELGATDALEFCQQHGFSHRDSELVAWLVRQHLLMSMTAQKQDIYDPEVIQRFASEVQTQQRLDYLYCLTVADIRATHANLWNNWKDTLLETLYRATAEVLTHADRKQPDMRERIQNNRRLAMALLLSAGFEPAAVNVIWGRFTADYFNRHTPEQIAWHTQNLVHVHDEHQLPLILIGDENNTGTTELFIYHREEQHLFAKVAAVLDAEQLSIQDAQILNTRDGYVMDTFVLLQRDGEPLVNDQRIEEVKQHLHDVLRHRSEAPEQHRSLSRRMRNFTVNTRVNFLSHRHARRTMFELITLDRPGLIATLARVFQQLNIVVMAARITTVGEQAEDLFIVTSAEQQALTEAEQQELRDTIVHTLENE